MKSPALSGKITLAAAVLFGALLFMLPSCGETKTGNTDTGPVADTNADQSPGMTQNNNTPEVDEAQLNEEDKQKATGTWVQMQSGEVYATLVCKYNGGAIEYSLYKGSETKALIQDKADNINDSYYFEGNNGDCPVTLQFDKEKFTVQMSGECKTTSMDFNGVYTRK